MSLLILFVFALRTVMSGAEILSPGWQQYYPSTQSWSHASGGGVHSTDTISLRPPRHRIGQGRYRMIPPASAELNCDFPESMLMISNVVWERADIGNRDLHQIYKRAGIPHQYDVHVRPGGSTLHIFDVTPLDRGIYRCIATGLDPSSNSVVTLFQDTDFFPEQTIGLNKLIKRDYIVPVVSSTERYHRPHPSTYYATSSSVINYHTVPYSYTTVVHPTLQSYTVDSEFVYSNGHKDQPMAGNESGGSVGAGEGGTSKPIYVYDKNSYLHNFITDRNDNNLKGGQNKEHVQELSAGAGENGEYKST